MLCYTQGTFKERIGKHYETNGIMRCVHALVSETAKLVAEYEAFGVTYDAEKDQWYFNGEEVRYFRDVLTSNGESLTSGKFRGEMRTLGSGVGTIDIYTVRDYGHLNSEHHGTLTGIEKYSQEEFDEHTQAGMSGNQPIGNASHN